MDYKALKKQIEERNIPSVSFVLVAENSFLPKQYLYAISEIINLEITYVDSFTNSLFDDDSIQVMCVESLDKYIPVGINQVIICSKVNKSITEKYDNLVEFPKLTNENVSEFVFSELNGFNEDLSTELSGICNFDIYKTFNEVNKLKYIDDKLQKEIYNKLRISGEYNTEKDVGFDLSNAIVKRDITEVERLLTQYKFNVNVFGLVSMLIKSFKNVMSIQFYKYPTAQLAGLSDKQFWAIKKYNVGRYTNSQLVKILDFLLSIDYNVKVGNINTDTLLDDVICTVLGV